MHTDGKKRPNSSHCFSSHLPLSRSRVILERFCVRVWELMTFFSFSRSYISLAFGIVVGLPLSSTPKCEFLSIVGRTLNYVGPNDRRAIICNCCLQLCRFECDYCPSSNEYEWGPHQVHGAGCLINAISITCAVRTFEKIYTIPLYLQWLC